MVALPVAKSTTQSTDLDLQIGFVDERCWPNLGDQLFLADQLTSAFDQSGQDVEGAAAKPHWLVALEQEPLSHEEPVRAERDVHGAAPGLTAPSFFLPDFTKRGQRAGSGRYKPEIVAEAKPATEPS